MTDQHMNDLRAHLARQIAAFYAGQGEYPMGQPPLLSKYDSKNMWDTAPRSFRYSEYGTGAGSV